MHSSNESAPRAVQSALYFEMGRLFYQVWIRFSVVGSLCRCPV